MGEVRHLGPEDAEVIVRTFAEGMLSPLAHDLKLSVGAFELTVTDDAVTGRFEAASLTVVCAMKGEVEAPGALSKRDQRTIEKNLAKDVLQVRRHPTITFESTRVEVGEAGGELTGHLTLTGRTRPVQVQVEARGKAWVGRARLNQPDFGIKPYSAMMGTLKVEAEVEVIVRIPRDAG